MVQQPRCGFPVRQRHGEGTRGQLHRQPMAHCPAARLPTLPRSTRRSSPAKGSCPPHLPAAPAA
jgi:hypothetical protein